MPENPPIQVKKCRRVIAHTPNLLLTTLNRREPQGPFGLQNIRGRIVPPCVNRRRFL